jgi:hypothetical protein
MQTEDESANGSRHPWCLWRTTLVSLEDDLDEESHHVLQGRMAG